jgi:hypothetical protein
MTSDSTVVVDDGDSHIVVNLSDSTDNAIEARSGEEQGTAARPEITSTSRARREAGDHVNRFLLCTLIGESAKSIRKTAQKGGETLPMTMIVRGVLRSYRLAAEDKYGPLAEAEPDMAGLKRLNEKVLRSEIARHSRDRVKSSEVRLAHAQRLGDDTKIKAERESLEQAIILRDRRVEESL